MNLVLDTNALSAIAEGDRGATQELSHASEVAIPVVVLGEYRFGITSSRRKREYERWLSDMISVCRVLEIDDHTASWYAELRSELKLAGTPIPSNDTWIAALCRQHTLPLLSRDRHFDQIKGFNRLDW